MTHGISVAIQTTPLCKGFAELSSIDTQQPSPSLSNRRRCHLGFFCTFNHPPDRDRLTRPTPSTFPFTTVEAHCQGWNHRKVRYPLRCLAPSSDQEDRNLAALQVHLHFLRQGLGQAQGRRHLGVPCLQEGHGWWCLDPQHLGCCHRPIVSFQHISIQIHR